MDYILYILLVIDIFIGYITLETR